MSDPKEQDDGMDDLKSNPLQTELIRNYDLATFSSTTNECTETLGATDRMDPAEQIRNYNLVTFSPTTSECTETLGATGRLDPAIEGQGESKFPTIQRYTTGNPTSSAILVLPTLLDDNVDPIGLVGAQILHHTANGTGGLDWTGGLDFTSQFASLAAPETGSMDWLNSVESLILEREMNGVGRSGGVPCQIVHYPGMVLEASSTMNGAVGGCPAYDFLGLVNLDGHAHMALWSDWQCATILDERGEYFMAQVNKDTKKVSTFDPLVHGGLALSPQCCMVDTVSGGPFACLTCEVLSNQQKSTTRKSRGTQRGAVIIRRSRSL